MKTIRIGVPCACQNGHTATWWYRLEDLRWVDEGVKESEKCQCPKGEFGQGYRRGEGPIQSSEATEDYINAVSTANFFGDQFDRLAKGLDLEGQAEEVVDYLLDRYGVQPEA